MIDKKKLASALRGQDQTDKPININITLDMSSLAGALKATETKEDEYQKVAGLSHNVSG